MRTRLSVCIRKRRFGCADDALAAAEMAETDLRQYRCDRCRAFHLTSRRKGKRIARPISTEWLAQ
ncbi:hypothetical protein GRI62_10625 [Erythrobacter arachoides]|uniref:Uncharacterized protein n=1 Tax=Aurantiacibacter arachoides TaxID=1850444 RepID=A0A845A1P3_9SPHN|nr:hypothetical protein [Aurantiacibacter arachoides]MXO94055.1 hypothetical protein [Aurantiacibacter arachoides]